MNQKQSPIVESFQIFGLHGYKDVTINFTDTTKIIIAENGSGKTTTIGKLARRYVREGRKVMLVAGDTFRAAAVEQLQIWADRNDVPCVAQATGADPAAVVFDGLAAAQARGMDVLAAVA